MAGIRRETLMNSLIKYVRSGNQLAWESMKKMIKSLEYEKLPDFKGFSVEDRRKYLTYVKWSAQDDVLDDQILQKRGCLQGTLPL